MPLFIDRSVLKVDNTNVQSSINLEDLLMNHTEYFENAFEKSVNYDSLYFCVSVRSMYSNRVLELNADEKKIYYFTASDFPRTIHRGYDLVMYLASVCLLQHVNLGSEKDAIAFNDIMAKESTFQPIGIYVSDLLAPIVYSQIILTDSGFDKMIPYLKENVKAVRIEDMKTEGNVPSLVSKLVCVERHDEL